MEIEKAQDPNAPSKEKENKELQQLQLDTVQKIKENKVRLTMTSKTISDQIDRFYSSRNMLNKFCKFIDDFKFALEKFTLKNSIVPGGLVSTVLKFAYDKSMEIQIGFDKPLSLENTNKKGSTVGRIMEFQCEYSPHLCCHCGEEKYHRSGCIDKGKIRGNLLSPIAYPGNLQSLYQWFYPTPMEKWPNRVLLVLTVTKPDYLCTGEASTFVGESNMNRHDDYSGLTFTAAEARAIEETEFQCVLQRIGRGTRLNVPVRTGKRQHQLYMQSITADIDVRKGEEKEQSPLTSPDVSPPISPKSILLRGNHSYQQSSMFSDIVSQDSSSEATYTAKQVNFSAKEGEERDADENEVDRFLNSPNPFDLVFFGPDIARDLNCLDLLRPLDFYFGQPNMGKRGINSQGPMHDPIQSNKKPRMCEADFLNEVPSDEPHPDGTENDN